VTLCPTSLLSGKLFFFRGAPFFGVCGVLFYVLSRSVFAFSRRGTLDDTVLRSVIV
jgi:hypothetical protein